MTTKYSKEFALPPDLPQILRDLTREILRNQPDDINKFALEYFEDKISGKPKYVDSITKYVDSITNNIKSNQNNHDILSPTDSSNNNDDGLIENKIQIHAKNIEEAFDVSPLPPPDTVLLSARSTTITTMETHQNEMKDEDILHRSNRPNQTDSDKRDDITTTTTTTSNINHHHDDETSVNNNNHNHNDNNPYEDLPEQEHAPLEEEQPVADVADTNQSSSSSSSKISSHIHATAHDDTVTHIHDPHIDSSKDHHHHPPPSVVYSEKANGSSLVHSNKAAVKDDIELALVHEIEQVLGKEHHIDSQPAMYHQSSMVIESSSNNINNNDDNGLLGTINESEAIDHLHDHLNDNHDHAHAEEVVAVPVTENINDEKSN